MTSSTILWSVYWIGFAITFVIVAREVFSCLVEDKRTIARLQASLQDEEALRSHLTLKRIERNISDAWADYHICLWMLPTVPFVAACIWPPIIGAVVICSFFWSIGWLLDQAVTAAMRKGDNNET